MDYPEILKEIPKKDLREWARVNGFDVRDFDSVEKEWNKQNIATPITKITP